MKLHVVELFIDAALELDPWAECLADDLRAAWGLYANAGWPLERLLEELAARGVTVDARRDKRRAFAGVRLNAVWRLLIAERKLEAMGISKMVALRHEDTRVFHPGSMCSRSFRTEFGHLLHKERS